MRFSSASIAAVTAAFILAAQNGTARAAEIKLLSSNALKTVVEELKPHFEMSTEHKLVITFAAAANLKTQIEKGESFDLAILTAPIVEDLIKLIESNCRSSARRLAPISHIGELAASFPFFLFVPGHGRLGLRVRILNQCDVLFLGRAGNERAGRDEQKSGGNPWSQITNSCQHR